MGSGGKRGANETMVDSIPQTLPIGSPSGKPVFIPATGGDAGSEPDVRAHGPGAILSEKV